jgi:hypothetical protein
MATIDEGVWVNIFGANGPDYITDVLETGSYTHRIMVSQNTGCVSVSQGQEIVNSDPDVFVSAI